MEPLTTTAAKLKLYSQLRGRAPIKRAWIKIRSNSFSKRASRLSHALAQKFSDNEDRGLERIREALRKKAFVFPPARGVAIQKPGKSTKRPLVVFDIESRIVQRAILDVVKELPPIKQTLQSGFNFGGVEGDAFGTAAAIEKARKAIRQHAYFIRSDIKSFFDNVTRDVAVERLTQHIHDEDFINLLRAATTVELANRESLGEDIKYFPSDDHGLAQGSCLSPLLCNLVLEEFDRRMNSHGTCCIRYVDDFIIFAADRRRARAALNVGLCILQQMNLSAYDPQISKEKAEEGPTTQAFDFLGCELTPTAVRPSIKNRRKLLAKVDKVLAIRGASLTEILNDVSRTVLGWGNTFGFCDDEGAFGNLDRELHSRVQKCVHSHIGRSKNFDAVAWLTSLGIQPLAMRKRPTN